MIEIEYGNGELVIEIEDEGKVENGLIFRGIMLLCSMFKMYEMKWDIHVNQCASSSISKGTVITTTAPTTTIVFRGALFLSLGRSGL